MKKKSHLIILLLVVFLLLNACGGETTTPTTSSLDVSTVVGEEPTETPMIEPEEIELTITQTTIDGDPSDWEDFDVLVIDPEGDHEGGGFDIAAISGFMNDQFLYVLIKTYGIPTDYEVLDLDIWTVGRKFIVNSSPATGNALYMGEIVNDDWVDHGEIEGGQIAFQEAIEIKIPLSAFGEVDSIELFIRPTGGVCCEWPDWYNIDDAESSIVPKLDQIESKLGDMGTLSEADATGIPSVCADDIEAAVPFGSFDSAPVEFSEGGFAAEWFVAPGKLKMPVLVFVSPEGEKLVYARYDKNLYKVTDDGSLTIIAEDIESYDGDIDDQGNIYFFDRRYQNITKVASGGTKSNINLSQNVITSGWAPLTVDANGSMLFAVSKSTEVADLFKIESTGNTTLVAEDIPALVSLAFTPDGSAIGLGNDKIIYEISPLDFGFTALGVIPSDDFLSPNGLTFDNQGNMFISTGDRSASGQVYQVDTTGNISLYAEISGNGLAGIAWDIGSDEILGTQLITGSLVAVGKDGDLREIVSGNGIITPAGIGFSPCGELIVPNDEGAMASLIDPTGNASWYLSYASFSPPESFVAFSPDGRFFVSESEPTPGAPKRIAMRLPGDLDLQTLYEGTYPSGVAYRTDGTLFISDTGAGEIIQIGSDGTARLFVEGLEYPQALAFDVGGNLYVVVGATDFVADEVFSTPSQGNAIVRISPEGEITNIAQVSNVVGLAIGPNGDLFTTETDSILRISPDGTKSTFARLTGHKVGIAFDLPGNLYIAAEGYNGIARVGGFPQGRLSGAVQDDSGNPVSDARVQVLSVDPIVVGQVIFTDAEGKFTIPAAQRNYKIIVSAKGYEDYSMDDIVVTPDQDAAVEIKLTSQ